MNLELIIVAYKHEERRALLLKKAFFTNFFSIALDGFDVTTNLITYCTTLEKKKKHTKKLLHKNIEKNENTKNMDVTDKIHLYFIQKRQERIIAVASRKYPRRFPKRGKK